MMAMAFLALVTQVLTGWFFKVELEIVQIAIANNKFLVLLIIN